MRRREFITPVGSAAAWPLTARAQNTVPVIGFLGTGSEAHSEGQMTAFRRGLSQVGFDEGRNVAFEFRWAEGRYERLPAMAAELANDKPLEREPIDRARARVAALLKANAAPRCGARSKRTGKPCQGAAMPNGRCKFHGGKSTGPRTPEGLERSRRANWKHGHYSREAKAERSRLREALLTLRDLCHSI
jgi:hypothetical protein